MGIAHLTEQRYCTYPVGWATPTAEQHHSPYPAGWTTPTIPRPRGNSGFTLLEMVIVVILISILGLFVMDRVWSLRIAAERAAIQQVIGNLRSALGMEVARYALENRLAELSRLDGSNPMRLLAQTPDGYAGEMPAASATAAGSWYFDPATGSLLYRPRYAQNGGGETTLLRWRITLVYGDRNANSRFDPGADLIEGLDLVRLPP